MTAPTHPAPDVLAVLDSEIEHYRVVLNDAKDEANYHFAAEIEEFQLRPLEQARAAVAELIDKAQFLVDGLDEEYVAWPARVLMLRAALAKVQP